jgi:hypothetical protein
MLFIELAAQKLLGNWRATNIASAYDQNFEHELSQYSF